ncbi:hypothetical protein Tsubulata_036796 [Turnera subulata]|uniref:SnoaL-like domain-containing protein n=1 Tax=Turnera subulata TaxID=218843 RepID=A0A9Q0GHM5_9ROSI|nr:hypothetical protein Tsubulata_036796 [Turnera subulata]
MFPGSHSSIPRKKMAGAPNFSGQIPRQAICFNNTMSRPLLSSPLIITKSPQLMQNNMKKMKHGLCLISQARNDTFKKRRATLLKSLEDDVSSTLGSLSASDMIEQFYACINDKKLKELESYISKDCCLEDCSFPYPIQGKKEVLQFYRQLIAGMGTNVKFHIDHICEDQKFTAGVNWHLEWKRIPIPFTRGCSFYECIEDGEKLVIKY